MTDGGDSCYATDPAIFLAVTKKALSPRKPPSMAACGLQMGQKNFEFVV
jgi:hypothetical protein